MEIDIVPFQARLERVAFNNHMQIVQCADIESVDKPPAENFIRAIVIGQSFGDKLMERFGSEDFNFHINLIKNHIANTAYQIYHLLTIEGYDALITEPTFLKSNSSDNLNHTFAKLAGVGHTGKNNFFVSPTYGVKIVICSVLTNAPLEFDPEFNMSLCKKCSVCDNNDYIDSVINCPYGKNKTDE